jgi:3,4-dihydroxy-2-butanone 4-phosphate synthase
VVPARGFNKIPTTLQRCSLNLVVTVQRHSWAARTQQETTMHPTIMNDIAKHRIADWHRQADRARTARAVRAADTKHAPRRPGHLAVVLARRVRAALGLPSLRPPAQPGQTRKATP